jgi:asparagine synthase (glutamine-hydrolysing)
MSDNKAVGFAHRRLAIIDLTPGAAQPMTGNDGSVITYNGEIYNYRELRRQLESRWSFRSQSDTEVILAAHHQWPSNFVDHLRGMFSFAIWNSARNELVAYRDRFGIKPLYYTVVERCLYFASEAKALLPFLKHIETDPDALADYLTFQFVLGTRTLFAGVQQVEPGHRLVARNGSVTQERYWDVRYDINFGQSPDHFRDTTRALLEESIEMHLRSDVEVGAYVSGGIDSSLVATLARRSSGGSKFFHGRFTDYPGYDESAFAQAVSDANAARLLITDITATDFESHLRDVIYHLDYPVAGPGSFPQYMVSQLASQHVKVVVGGQGGDEIFGGYARYLIAYFEQCIKAAIDGTYKNGNFVVTIESIVPNLGVLREYKPLLAEFWKDGLFGPIDERYFRLINRAVDADREFNWSELNPSGVYERYSELFNSRENFKKEALFDRMTHFDFKTLLPALLHVEDRMSMAHGLESRVPLLDHPLVEFVATAPADVKFEGGQMKQLLKQTFANELPTQVLNRRDKMGFPVPLAEWLSNDLGDMSIELMKSMSSHDRPGINSRELADTASSSPRFSRKTWALMSLEVWYQTFHDRQSFWRSLSESQEQDDQGGGA